ncbi:MAG: hypothetical protein HQL65_03180 [Magnetococcales bacterium]|nr:hypothetical protein [Magnetococcales bacterium]
MGTGTLTGFDLSGRISLALRELALQRCTCASVRNSPGSLGQECAVHALDFDAMANSVLEIVEKYQ